MYVEATTEHRSVSEAELSEVAEELSSRRAGTSDRPLYVRIGHFNHGAFLNNLLYGFAILPVVSLDHERPIRPGVDELGPEFARKILMQWAEPADVSSLIGRRTATLASVPATSAESPFTWAVVINIPVEMQIENVLQAAATLLARQSYVSNPAGINPVKLHEDAASIDEIAHRGVKDVSNAYGWRAAARELKEQSVAQGTPLQVSYSAPLLTPEEVSTRVPLARHVYNTFANVRLAVDKTVASISQNILVSGSGSESSLRRAQELFDAASLQHYTAHTIRDSFVCGNGILLYGQDPVKDMRLIDPVGLRSVDGDFVYILQDDGNQAKVGPVSHQSGAHQVGSDIGMSILEPFIKNAMDRSLWMEMLLTARAWQQNDQAQSLPSIAKYSQEMPSVAIGHLHGIAESTRELIGTATNNLSHPGDSIYFDGAERMTPDVRRISLTDKSENSA